MEVAASSVAAAAKDLLLYLGLLLYYKVVELVQTQHAAAWNCNVGKLGPQTFEPIQCFAQAQLFTYIYIYI